VVAVLFGCSTYVGAKLGMTASFYLTNDIEAPTGRNRARLYAHRSVAPPFGQETRESSSGSVTAPRLPPAEGGPPPMWRYPCPPYLSLSFPVSTPCATARFSCRSRGNAGGQLAALRVDITRLRDRYDAQDAYTALTLAAVSSLYELTVDLDPRTCTSDRRTSGAS
jgi:hypothetical protein